MTKKIVATKKLMLQHNNELKADISVMRKENYVAKIKVAESDFYRDREFLCCDRKYKRSEMSQGKFIATRDSMLHTKSLASDKE